MDLPGKGRAHEWKVCGQPIGDLRDVRHRLQLYFGLDDILHIRNVYPKPKTEQPDDTSKEQTHA